MLPRASTRSRNGSCTRPSRLLLALILLIAGSASAQTDSFSVYQSKRLDALLNANACTTSPCDLAPGTTVGGVAIGGGGGSVDWAHVPDLNFEGFITHLPEVRTDFVLSPFHLIHDEAQLWFAIDGAKFLCTDDWAGTEVPQISDGDIPDAADGFCDSDGVTRAGKTKTVGREWTTVNLTKSEHYGRYTSVFGGGDTDIVGEEFDIFSTGGNQSEGDEGEQWARVYLQDYWLNVTATTGANLTAGAGSSTIPISGMTEAMSKMLGEGKLAIFTGSEVAVDLTDRPPGVVNTSGALDSGDPAWSFDGSATGQGVWTLGAGQVTSSGVQSTGWCFSPVDSNYLDINGQTAEIWLQISAVNSGADTVTTRWNNQGYNGKTPYPMIASESTGSQEAKVAPCAELGDPVFSGGIGDLVADSTTFIKGAGFPAISSGATFEVFAYPGIRQMGAQIFFVNNLGRMYESGGLRLVSVIGGEAFEGRFQSVNGLDLNWTGGALNTLKDGTHSAWVRAVNCSAYDAYGAACGVGIDFYYPPDPGEIGYFDWLAEIEWSTEDWDDDIDRVVVRTNNNSTHNLTLDKTDGWGQNGNYFLHQDNFNSIAEFSSILGITGTQDASHYLAGNGTWATVPSGGAPTTVDYLVGTADATLSGEIVVGTSPGGELGGTWASPTIDDGLSVSGWTITGSPTIDLTSSVGPTPVLEGRVEWDSNDDHFVVGASGAAVEFIPTEDFSGDATVSLSGNVSVADNSHSHDSTTVTEGAGTDISADLEEESHCSEHDSADVNCTGETIVLADDSVGIAELTPDPAADDQVMISDSVSAATWRALPSCSNATTSKLLYDTATNTFSCGTDQGGGSGAGYAEIVAAGLAGF